MDRTTAPRGAISHLYPPVEPFDQRLLDTGDGHRIHVEQCGAPGGVPVLVLHGGPGGGCSPMMRRFFDPAHFRIILFDQRGCGRSLPHADIRANTTWHLVADIERIRRALGIDGWVLFGGSWGATLALVYAITHPDRVRHLALRGVFLMTRAELDWFYAGGAGQFFPEAWARFAQAVPEAERGDLIGAYHRRLFSGDLDEEVAFARLWAGWENMLASIDSPGMGGEGPGRYARAFARLENHYFTHAGFLDCDGWILAQVARIAHLPASIVQGRYDMVCPPHSAFRLAGRLPRAALKIVPLAGHALSEPGIASQLVRTMDGIRDQIVPIL